MINEYFFGVFSSLKFVFFKLFTVVEPFDFSFAYKFKEEFDIFGVSFILKTLFEFSVCLPQQLKHFVKIEFIIIF